MFSWKGKDITDLDGKKLSRNAPAYVILLLAVLAMTFFGVCSPSGSNSFLPSGAAASVNGEDISVLQFKRAHIQRVQQAQNQYKGDFDAAKLGISQAVVNGLVDQEVYYQAANHNGIAASTEEVEDAIIEGQYFQNDKGKFDADLFKRYLRQQQYSEATFSEELKRSIANQKLRSFLTTTYRSSKEADKLEKTLSETKLNVEFVAIEPHKLDVAISDEQVEEFLKEGGEEKVKSYYNRNNKEYNRPESVRVRHILISYQGAARATGDALKRSKEEAKNLAEKVQAEVQAQPTSFVSAVKKYTDEPSGKTKGGDLGYIEEGGDMVAPEFSKAAFALNKGGVSDVVETRFGFHIIKVEDKKAALSVSLDDAKKDIAKKLASQEKRPALAKAAAENVLNAVKAKDGVDEALKKHNLSWKETGDFAINARFLPGGLGSDANIRKAVLGLKSEGQVVENLMEANGNFYILRLKERTEADLSKLAEEDDLADRSQAFEAFWTYNRLLKDVKKRYENEGLIYKNNEFVQYDAIVKSKQGSGS